VLFGVLHDQVTARLSLEYFTIAHPRLFASDSPTLHALAWGVLGTWWVGLVLGLALAVSARAGARPKLDARSVRPLLAAVMAGAAAASATAGLVAWALSASGAIALAPAWSTVVSPEQHTGFLVASWMHLASYAAGALGGLAACRAARRRRAGILSSRGDPECP
jgi:hypothetical protein